MCFLLYSETMGEKTMGEKKNAYAIVPIKFISILSDSLSVTLIKKLRTFVWSLGQQTGTCFPSFLISLCPLQTMFSCVCTLFTTRWVILQWKWFIPCVNSEVKQMFRINVWALTKWALQNCRTFYVSSFFQYLLNCWVDYQEIINQ